MMLLGWYNHSDCFSSRYGQSRIKKRAAGANAITLKKGIDKATEFLVGKLKKIQNL